MEGGANVLPDQAVGKCKNASLGTALEARCVTGTAVDRFAQVKEHTVEPVTAVEGDVRAGASTAERMRTLGAAGVLHLDASHIS